MKTKTKIIVGMIILIAIVILIRFLILPEIKTTQFNTIVDSCNIIGSGTVQGFFSCPANLCQVYGFKTCNTLVEGKRVIFRTNSISKDDYSIQGKWISINGIPSGKSLLISDSLFGFCRTSTILSGPGTILERYTSHNNRMSVYNSKLFIETQGKWVQYDSCSSADLTLTPKDPYSSNNQEIYSGLNLYSCQTPAYKNGIRVETAIYSQEKPGDYSTNVYDLTTSHNFSFDGSINYAVLDNNIACIVDTCNDEKTGFYECNIVGGCPQKSSQLIQCPSGEYCVQKSSGAICEIPFSLNVVFQDENGKTKTAFTTSENIFLSILINSNSEKYANLAVKLLDSQDNIASQEQIKTITFPNSISWNVKFNSQNSTGSYKALLKIGFDGKTVERYFDTRVSNPISIATRAFSAQGTSLYSNQISNIEIRVFDDSGNPTTANTNLIAKLNGKTLTTPQPTIKTLGNYQYEFTLGEEGLLNIESSAEKFGYVTKQSTEFIILPLDIRIEFRNIDKILNIGIGTQTVEFTTKNPQGELINTNNDVSVITPSGIVQKLSNVMGSSGQYSFIFNFDKEGGYKIKVRSTAPGFIAKEQETPFINVVKGTPIPDCFENEDCNLGQICKNGKCEDEQPFNWLLLSFFIVGSLVFIILIIIIIILKIRNKKGLNSLNLDGGTNE